MVDGGVKCKDKDGQNIKQQNDRSRRKKNEWMRISSGRLERGRNMSVLVGFPRKVAKVKKPQTNPREKGNMQPGRWVEE